MRLLLTLLALAGALLAAPGVHAQSQSDDRFTNWDNRMRGHEPVREWRWVVASWYDCRAKGQCSKSKRTASGERFDPHALTFAHKRLPFGTRVRFRHHGQSVVCRANDRGPYVAGREYDLGAGCARAIGMIGIARIGATRI